MIFDFLKNDYEVVWTDVDNWFDGWSYYKANYEILFSPSKKKYKLITRDNDPKFRPLYKKAIDKLNEFKKS